MQLVMPFCSKFVKFVNNQEDDSPRRKQGLTRYLLSYTDLHLSVFEYILFGACSGSIKMQPRTQEENLIFFFPKSFGGYIPNSPKTKPFLEGIMQIPENWHFY
jgi:hypothetical protein